MTAPTPPIYDLAETLHTKLCHFDHTDQCVWWYENDRESPWSEWTHKRYLEKANKLRDITGLHLADLIKVIENV